ncbi:MAG: hypothetical protein RI575_18025 [Balneolaceae bacterium]|nr:hypothetical protein [Balneolaceae bacterium]MDR9409746.1 hypothetical protein [Balneolaceae bacterium]
MFRKTFFGIIITILSISVSFAQEKVVETYTGNGGKNTRPFTVDDEWEIQWNASGDIFQLYLYSKDGDLIGVPANQQGAGNGSSYQAKSGSYYLQVNALGKWEIEIVQLSSNSDNPSSGGVSSESSDKYIAKFSGNGGKNTRPFSPNGAWEIKWDAKGDLFQLYLYSEDGDLIGVPANQQGAGTGTSYQPKSGSYYLQVNALGEWEIEIVPVN